MSRNKIFNKLISVTGIITHGLDLIHILVGFFIPLVGDILMFVAGPLYLLWFPLVGYRLIRLSSGKYYEDSTPRKHDINKTKSYTDDV